MQVPEPGVASTLAATVIEKCGDWASLGQRREHFRRYQEQIVTVSLLPFEQRPQLAADGGAHCLKGLAEDVFPHPQTISMMGSATSPPTRSPLKGARESKYVGFVPSWLRIFNCITSDK
ncbi:hypothetical protein [Rhizobium sullae]|uniref:hypothetical protein n=1 Tax=Rhizobium sullae TaxID=50338 RepID=UPI00117AA5CB|nr:hypothetical protein [Rhizobium sullae]